MSANTFGHLFKVTSFGESHGDAMGAVIEGCPAGVTFNEELLSYNLGRRRPGQSSVTTARNEQDEFEILSGVFEGKTLGTPLTLVVKNKDQRSFDYKNMPHRPGHADDLWQSKYGHADPRGGGRASGRETLSRVLGGSVAQMFLQQEVPELKTLAYTKKIFDVELDSEDYEQLTDYISKPQLLEESLVRMPSPDKSKQLEELLIRAKEEGKSYGGIVEVLVSGVPRGLGQPVFKKMKSDLAAAVMSIGATNGVEFGDGFQASEKEGTEYHQVDESPYGGLRGGITTGENLNLRVSFKPTSSVLDVAKKGRHDPCIVPRAVPVVESMVYLTLADHLLWSRLDQV